MKIIGLTGGIASGKTTVSQMLIDIGFPVICADELAKEAVQQSGPGLEAVIAAFGKEYLKPDGTLDRGKLGPLVFSDKASRKKLNSIVHPFVVQEIKKRLALYKERKASLIFLDIPLLFEEKLDRLCSKTVVIYAPKKIQCERLKKRNAFSNSEISARLAAQMPIHKKKKLADFVIDNSGSVKETKRQVEGLLKILMPTKTIFSALRQHS